MNEFIAELIGTMLLVLLGNGVVANVVLNGTKGNNSGWIVIAFGWGFGGYIRSGFGVDGNGNSLDVFKAPNAEAKYRLGNEAETYMEALGQFSLKDDNGAVFETNMRMAIVTPTNNSNAFETTFFHAGCAYLPVPG